MVLAVTNRFSPAQSPINNGVNTNFQDVEIFTNGLADGTTAFTGLTVTGSTSLTGTLTISGTWDGWIGANETWTYASATTFTISGDLSGKYQKGDKIKLTQTTAKYFYILSATHAAGTTTVTVNGGSDYSLANAAITLPFYSRSDVPFGFPDWFNWTPTLVGFSADPANAVYQFTLKGKVCTVTVRQGTAGTSNATNFTITTPIAAATVSNHTWGNTFWAGTDNGVALTAAGRAIIASAGTVITLGLDISGAAWTNANGKAASFTIIYQI